MAKKAAAKQTEKPSLQQTPAISSSAPAPSGFQSSRLASKSSQFVLQFKTREEREIIQRVFAKHSKGAERVEDVLKRVLLSE